MPIEEYNTPRSIDNYNKLAKVPTSVSPCRTALAEELEAALQMSLEHS